MLVDLLHLLQYRDTDVQRCNHTIKLNNKPGDTVSINNNDKRMIFIYPISTPSNRHPQGSHDRSVAQST